MALPKVIPALADLTQDVAGPVPVELLYAWASSDQDAARAEALLSPYRIDGTVVSTDTSGLSRLTKEKDLLDVLALISEPKQILHGIGVEIGGRAVGTWVADNSETFYPPEVAPATIVAGMSEAVHRISNEVPISVGMCIHLGTFYELGSGLYGQHADIVETLAENSAGPGEILVTQPVRAQCPATFAFKLREDLPGVSAVTRAPGMHHLTAANRRYPHPFPPEFFASLSALKTAPDPHAARQQIYDRYLQELVVVFVARVREPAAADIGPAMLDGLVANVLLDALVVGIENVKDRIAGMGGGLAILTFEAPDLALEAADVLRRKCAANGLVVKIGIAGGPVLYFSNPRGPSGIAGNPVNLASKISEDAGLPGKINIAGNVAAQLDGLDGADRFELTVGGVVLRGLTV